MEILVENVVNAKGLWTGNNNLIVILVRVNVKPKNSFSNVLDIFLWNDMNLRFRKACSGIDINSKGWQGRHIGVNWDGSQFSHFYLLVEQVTVRFQDDFFVKKQEGILIYLFTCQNRNFNFSVLNQTSYWFIQFCW